MSRYLPGTDPATMTTAGLPAGSSLQSILAQLIANRNGGGTATSLGALADRPEPSVNPGLAEDAVAGRPVSERFPGTGGLTPMIGPPRSGYSPPGGTGNVTSTDSIPGFDISHITNTPSFGRGFGRSGGMPMPYGSSFTRNDYFNRFGQMSPMRGGFGGMMGMGLGGGFGMGYPQMGGYGYGFGQGMGGFSRPSYGGYGGFGNPYGGYGGFSNPMMGMGLGSYGMNQSQPMNQFQDMRSMTAQQQPAMNSFQPMQSAQQQANPYQQQYQQAFY
jgi:hypothetical protein